jgi:tetratricopeptide (TPR) repeat protein
MSEVSRSETAHALEAASGADRDAKIEQLLLVGLDHYFAGQYEHAINVWTRALFLDRSHPRARAYIDRARSALAERQRECEELLHNGVTAFQRGDGAEARRLLRAALAAGAPAEEALALLDRLDRLEAGAAAPLSSSPRSTSRDDEPVQARRRTASVGPLAAAIVLTAGALAFGGYTAASRQRFEWPTLHIFDQRPPSAAAPVVGTQVLLPPRRGEIALSRARAFAASGHLSDALTVLETVRDTDPQRVEADRLRADIQRQLLALTSSSDRPLP